MNNHVVASLASLAMSAGHAAAQCSGGFNGDVIPIPDLGMVTRTFECNSAGTIGMIQVRLRINHPRQGDLLIRLRHNTSGVVATLMNRPGTEDGQSTEGYTAANLGGAQLFVFDDAASGPYAVPPVGAYPRPGVDSISGSRVVTGWSLNKAHMHVICEYMHVLVRAQAGERGDQPRRRL